jgi:tetratricopeptide (TPR) repeat protein
METYTERDGCAAAALPDGRVLVASGIYMHAREERMRRSATMLLYDAGSAARARAESSAANQYEKASIAELKKVLKQRRVDTSACVEKAELLAKAVASEIVNHSGWRFSGHVPRFATGASLTALGGDSMLYCGGDETYYDGNDDGNEGGHDFLGPKHSTKSSNDCVLLCGLPCKADTAADVKYFKLPGMPQASGVAAHGVALVNMGRSLLRPAVVESIRATGCELFAAGEHADALIMFCKIFELLDYRKIMETARAPGKHAAGLMLPVTTFDTGLILRQPHEFQHARRGCLAALSSQQRCALCDTWYACAQLFLKMAVDAMASSDASAHIELCRQAQLASQLSLSDAAETKEDRKEIWKRVLLNAEILARQSSSEVPGSWTHMQATLMLCTVLGVPEMADLHKTQKELQTILHLQRRRCTGQHREGQPQHETVEAWEGRIRLEAASGPSREQARAAFGLLTALAPDVVGKDLLHKASRRLGLTAAEICGFDPRSGLPKRPSSAFLFFTGEVRNKVTGENDGMKATDVSKRMGEMWRDLDEGGRQKYVQLATRARARYVLEQSVWDANQTQSPPRLWDPLQLAPEFIMAPIPLDSVAVINEAGRPIFRKGAENPSAVCRICAVGTQNRGTNRKMTHAQERIWSANGYQVRYDFLASRGGAVVDLMWVGDAAVADADGQAGLRVIVATHPPSLTTREQRECVAPVEMVFFFVCTHADSGWCNCLTSAGLDFVFGQPTLEHLRHQNVIFYITGPMARTDDNVMQHMETISAVCERYMIRQPELSFNQPGHDGSDYDSVTTEEIKNNLADLGLPEGSQIMASVVQPDIASAEIVAYRVHFGDVADADDVYLRECLVCGEPSARLACRGCKRASFCSVWCERTAWSAGHKTVCEAPPNTNYCKRPSRYEVMDGISEKLSIMLPDPWSEEAADETPVQKLRQFKRPSEKLIQKSKWHNVVVGALDKTHPNLTASLDALMCADQILEDLLHRLITTIEGQPLLTGTFATAVETCLLGELAVHAIKEMAKAQEIFVTWCESEQILVPLVSHMGLDLQGQERKLEPALIVGFQLSHHELPMIQVAFAAVLEYVILEVLDVAGNVALDEGRATIEKSDICRAVADDEELKMTLPKFAELVVVVNEDDDDDQFDDALAEHHACEATCRAAEEKKGLGNALFKQERFDEAINMYRQGIALLGWKDPVERAVLDQLLDQLQSWPLNPVDETTPLHLLSNLWGNIAECHVRVATALPLSKRVALIFEIDAESGSIKLFQPEVPKNAPPLHLLLKEQTARQRLLTRKYASKLEQAADAAEHAVTVAQFGARGPRSADCRWMPWKPLYRKGKILALQLEPEAARQQLETLRRSLASRPEQRAKQVHKATDAELRRLDSLRQMLIDICHKQPRLVDERRVTAPKIKLNFEAATQVCPLQWVGWGGSAQSVTALGAARGAYQQCEIPPC